MFRQRQKVATVEELKSATGRNKEVGNDSNTGTKSRIQGLEWTIICLSVHCDAFLQRNATFSIRHRLEVEDCTLRRWLCLPACDSSRGLLHQLPTSRPRTSFIFPRFQTDPNCNIYRRVPLGLKTCTVTSVA